MGHYLVALVEIDTFRIPFNPEVLDVQKVKKFLRALPCEDALGSADGQTHTVEVTETCWTSRLGYEDTVNDPNDPSKPIDEELTVSGYLDHTVRHGRSSRVRKYYFCSTAEKNNEYVANAHAHSLVIRCGEYGRDREYTLDEFAQVCQDMKAFRDMIVRRRLVPASSVTDAATYVHD